MCEQSVAEEMNVVVWKRQGLVSRGNDRNHSRDLQDLHPLPRIYANEKIAREERQLYIDSGAVLPSMLYFVQWEERLDLSLLALCVGALLVARQREYRAPPRIIIDLAKALHT